MKRHARDCAYVTSAGPAPCTCDYYGATEATQAGEQILIPGVTPISEAERLKRKAAAPLAPAVDQRPCDVGLFDDVARDQLDLCDLARKGRKP